MKTEKWYTNYTCYRRVIWTYTRILSHARMSHSAVFVVPETFWSGVRLCSKRDSTYSWMNRKSTIQTKYFNFLLELTDSETQLQTKSWVNVHCPISINVPQRRCSLEFSNVRWITSIFAYIGFNFRAHSQRFTTAEIKISHFACFLFSVFRFFFLVRVKSCFRNS